MCLFDSDGAETRFDLDDYDAGVWHGVVPGIRAGPGLRLPGDGAVRPGQRPALQPEQAAARPLRPRHRRLGDLGPGAARPRPDDPARPGQADSAPFVPRSLVTDQAGYDWEGDTQLRRRSADSVLYEVHVKGFTARHPDIPPELRGTYAGLAHEAATSYLRDLGVTAVELLPVHEHVPEAFLVDRGLTNYWGYNTIGFFAPHQGYSAAVHAPDGAGGQVNEFKDMVKALHRAGIEVILDVVYNHTAEGNENGPTLSFRGLDNGDVLPAGARRREQVLRHHGHRQLAERGQPVHAAADHGQPQVLDVGDARGRVQVRPGGHPRPGGGQPLRPALRVLRAGRAGPGDRPGEADRGAVGRRPGATATTSGSSPRSGGSGTAGTATPCATSGAARTSASPSSPPGSAGRPTCTARRAAARPPR